MQEKLPPGYKRGKLRAFYSSAVPQPVLALVKFTKIDHLYLFLVAAIAFSVRFFKLPSPSKVVFDEVHFGGFARNYFNGEFFVDVHPPLGKLTFYLIALLFNWDGDFDFEHIGDPYDKNVPFVAMRAVSAACGMLTVVLTYCTLRSTCCRPLVSLFGAFLVLVENSLATQSRFIMLDSQLIAYVAATVYCYKLFETSVAFTKQWYRYLFLTGISLGLATSVKLTGLFTVVWVLALSVYQIYLIAGDLDVLIKQCVKHVVSRFIAFLLIPLTVYCGIFAVHFILLPKNGPGSGFVSPTFKSQFIDSSDLKETAVDVSYGSTITLRHHRLNSYLHSHKFPYKTGTHEQQVTMYEHEGDGNNEWVIETTGTNYDGKFDGRFRAIKDGDYVKLYHKFTQKYLRANDMRPPNSEHDYSNEVSCNGNRTDTQDSNYEWKVKIVGRKPHAENQLPNIKVRATESVFQLVHRGTNCVLMGHDTRLPDWAFHQYQVLCVNEPTMPNTLWYVESNNHPVIDKDVDKYPRVKLPRMLLYDKLVEYHQAMWRANKGFVKPHKYASLPFEWPFVTRGIAYFTTGNTDGILTDENPGQVYLLGNVAIYYVGIFLIASFSFKLSLYILKHLNPFNLPQEPLLQTVYYHANASFLMGWILNYFPYLHMTRQLFSHHYLTSVLFMIMAISQYMEYQMVKNRLVGIAAMTVVLLAATYCFVTFLPLIYSTDWTKSKCQNARWFSSWDFDCSIYTD
uniref:Dolichyl-phosphate-mannose--protein mannosyltransferase n=1 Tax=Candidozyma auris TaxID=498019 RepID=A0A0L0NVI5_CANAR